jgi:hypothetical protein
MGKPRERMPVCCSVGGEGPDNTFKSEPGPHLVVLGHILVVVEADKGVVADLHKTEKRYDDESNADRYEERAASSTSAHGLPLIEK